MDRCLHRWMGRDGWADKQQGDTRKEHGSDGCFRQKHLFVPDSPTADVSMPSEQPDWLQLCARDECAPPWKAQTGERTQGYGCWVARSGGRATSLLHTLCGSPPLSLWTCSGSSADRGTQVREGCLRPRFANIGSKMTSIVPSPPRASHLPSTSYSPFQARRPL
jgi:hypothetical protein